jgi:hypothetical protein
MLPAADIVDEMTEPIPEKIELTREPIADRTLEKTDFTKFSPPVTTAEIKFIDPWIIFLINDIALDVIPFTAFHAPLQSPCRTEVNSFIMFVIIPIAEVIIPIIAGKTAWTIDKVN